MRHVSIFSLLISLVISPAVFGQKRGPSVPPARVPAAAINAIKGENLMSHIRTLASDEFEGRAPATRGEELTINYIAEQYKKLGLEPAVAGSSFQKVPLVGITADQSSKLTISTPAKQMSLAFGNDYVAWTKRVVNEASIADAELVFVGYGVVAPEYDWDDYKGLDVRGKVLVMLVNDPAVPDPKNPSQLDPKMFNGKAMTYYGRWTYKYEIAAEKGAAGAIVIHETGPAGYGWEVVTGSWSGEQFDLVAQDDNMSRVAIEGWISNPRAQELLSSVGQDLDALKRAAVRRDFKPVSLNARASLTLKNTVRKSDSNNVVGKITGTDLKDEYIIYMAHWDHLGVGAPNEKGDRIFNGALDNATGTGGLIEIARAYKSLPKPPRRSVLFLAVTAEEKGLLGSRHYAENPLYPLEKTVAVFNMDGLNMNGRTRNVLVIGLGNSTLDDVLRQAAREQGRVLSPDAEPEKGFYYRSDHFNFAKQGVPALYADSGNDFIGRPKGWGLEKAQEYTRNDYHKQSDEVKPDWNPAGAVQDLQLLLTVGYRIANSNAWPEWKPGTEFKAKREEMLRQAAMK